MEAPQNDDLRLQTNGTANASPEKVTLATEQLVKQKLKITDTKSVILSTKAADNLNLSVTGSEHQVADRHLISPETKSSADDVRTPLDQQNTSVDIFDRSEPLVLYSNPKKVRVVLLIAILVCLAISCFYVFGAGLPAFTLLPFLAPFVFLVIAFAISTRIEIIPLLTINHSGIAIKQPLVRCRHIDWADIKSVKIADVGVRRCLRINVGQSHNVNEQSSLLSRLLTSRGSSIDLECDTLPISAEAILSHIAEYAQAYGAKFDISPISENGSPPSDDKIRVYRIALLYSIVCLTIFGSFALGMHEVHKQYQSTLEHNMLVDLSNGDLYSGIRDKARLLAFDNRYKESTDCYFDYYDHSQSDRTQTGVRNSFVTKEIVELGEKYPPARAALIVRRNDREQKIFKNLANEDDVKQWCSANSYLEDSARTAQVLLELQKKQLPASRLVQSVVKKHTSIE